MNQRTKGSWLLPASKVYPQRPTISTITHGLWEMTFKISHYCLTYQVPTGSLYLYPLLLGTMIDFFIYLSYFSIKMAKHHGQGNLKKQVFN